MQRRIVNPWTWQEKYGFVQANEVTAVTRTLFIAGQTSCDADGNAMHAGDMRAQVEQALNNVETVLRSADMDFSNVVRLNVYTTDVGQMMQAHGYMTERLKNAGCRHAGTLLGVSALAIPDLMVEIEVTAVA
jgi:enamine deaminase RidA (YjgF/YER057c/UK114 family)